MQWSGGAPYYHDSHGFVVRTNEEKAKARHEVAKRYGITEFVCKPTQPRMGCYFPHPPAHVSAAKVEPTMYVHTSNRSLPSTS